MQITEKLYFHRGLLSLFVGASFIAFAPVFAKLAINFDGMNDGASISPSGVAFWRLMLSFPIYIFLFWWQGATKPTTKTPNPRLLLVPGLFFAADLACWHWAFEYTSLANATLEANLAAVIVGLAGWIWFKERLNWYYPIGAGIAITGLAFLVGFSFESTSQALAGDLLGTATAFCYAGYLISIKLLTRQYSILKIMMATSVMGSAALAVITLATPGLLIPNKLVTWYPLLGLALVSQVGGQTLIAYGLKYVPASISGAILLCQPLITAILGWMIFQQVLTISQIIAGFIVVLGIYIVKRSIN